MGFIYSKALSPWLMNGHCLPMSSHGFPPVCVCVLISHSDKDTSHIGIGLTLVTSFNSNYLFKDPIYKYNHIQRY